MSVSLHCGCVGSANGLSSSQTHQAKAAKAEARKTLAEDKGYWLGEWICADCGYIYDPELFGGIFFEQQTKGFKCPQCSGPRRRYAKKVFSSVDALLALLRPLSHSNKKMLLARIGWRHSGRHP